MDQLGQFYTEMRRWKDAEDAYAKATTLSIKTDDRVYLLFLKGALAERQKHYEPAEQLFRQALELDSNNAATPQLSWFTCWQTKAFACPSPQAHPQGRRTWNR